MARYQYNRRPNRSSDRSSTRELREVLGSTFRNSPRVFRLLCDTSPGITVAFAATIVIQSLLPAATIWVTKLLIDAVVAAIAAGGTDASIQPVVTLVIVQLALAAGSMVTQHGGSTLRAMLGDRFSNRINIMILEKAESLDLRYFEDSQFYDMLDNARREANFRPVGIITAVFALGGNIIQVISISALLVALAWWILLVVLATSIPYLAVDVWFARRRYWLQTRRAPESRELWYLGYVMTSDETVKEVRLFDLGSHLLERYRHTFAKFYRENRRLTLSRESTAFVLGLISAGAAAGIYAFVALATIAGRLTLGDLTLYHQALTQSQD